MKYLLVLLLVAAMAFSLTACEGKTENGGADPGNSIEGDSRDVKVEPEITPGKWLTVNGGFYKFSDVSFVNAFQAIEFAFSDDFGCSSFRSQYLGDDVIDGLDTRHFAVTGVNDDLEIYLELWFTVTGELVQLGEQHDEGIVPVRDPRFLALQNDEIIHYFCYEYLIRHGLFAEEEGYEPGTLYTDPNVFDTADHDYVINEISSEERDLGAGMVTVYRYDYSSPGLFDVVEKIAKIGDKYMFIHCLETLEDGFTMEFNVTRVVPFY